MKYFFFFFRPLNVHLVFVVVFFLRPFLKFFLRATCTWYFLAPEALYLTVNFFVAALTLFTLAFPAAAAFVPGIQGPPAV